MPAAEANPEPDLGVGGEFRKKLSEPSQDRCLEGRGTLGGTIGSEFIGVLAAASF